MEVSFVKVCLYTDKDYLLTIRINGEDFNSNYLYTKREVLKIFGLTEQVFAELLKS